MVADPIHKETRPYCFTGALAGAAGVFEAFTCFAAFLFATLAEFTGFAVVAFVDFLAFLTGLVVEVCGVTGALEGGVLWANIAAAVNIVNRIVRFIFVSPFDGGAFDLPLHIHLAAICFSEH